MASSRRRALSLLPPSLLLLIGVGVWILLRAGWGRIDRVMMEQHDRLIRQGFNSTFVIKYGTVWPRSAETRKFLVPHGGDRRVELYVFNHSLTGQTRFSVREAGSASILDVKGKSFSESQHLQLDGGEYEVHAALGPVTFGGLVLGLKGRVIWEQELDPRRYTEVAAQADKGFHWPYLLYLPRRLSRDAHLLVVPNNTGFTDDDERIHLESAKDAIREMSELADRLSVPLLMPAFPRPAREENIYTHALDRDELSTADKEIRRLDLQLAAMIDDARGRLEGQGTALGRQVFLFGFSASGMFVNRFAFLHPEMVAALACGSPGGWPIAPVAEFRGRTLRYPIGVADLQGLVGHPLDTDALRRVPMFFFLGGKDANDSVIFRDGYDPGDERLIFSLFGATLQDRWKAADSLYTSAGVPAQFALYLSAGHEVTAGMKDDVVRFFTRIAPSSDPLRSTGPERP